MLEQTLLEIWDSIVAGIPGLIFAILTLLIGLGVGKLIGRIVREILLRSKIDKWTTEREKLPFRLYNIFDIIVRWLIYLVAIQQAAVFLGIVAVTTFVNSVIGFIPKLIGAAVIVIVGYVLAAYIKDRIIATKTLYADIVGKVIFFLLLYLSIALALPYVGIDPTLINWILLVMIASIGLGIAIALGLGLKDVVAESARRYAKKFPKR